MSKTVKLYVVRHGETYLNRYHKLQGWADSPLTEEGKAVAIRTGERLSHIAFDRVYTSDLGRTIETAELILKQNKHSDPLELCRLPQFREVFFGSFEGDHVDRIVKEVAAQHGYQYETSREVFEHHSMSEVLAFMKQADPAADAEDADQLQARINQGIEQLLSDVNDQAAAVLLVTHGVVIRQLLDRYTDHPEHQGEVKNASVSVLEFTGDRANVLVFNSLSGPLD